MFEKIKIKKEIKKLNILVANGNTQAMYDLAMIYLDGTIIKKDAKKAHSLLVQASNNGHLQAKTYLLSNKIIDGAITGAKAINDIVNILKD